jgi:threonine dehydrogenase-like Zn-dependent dehydrogenase
LDSGSQLGISTQYSSKFDVVIDATGSPQGLTLAAKLCKPMGTVVLKSTCASGSTFNAAPFVIDELQVVGSRCGPIDKALEFLDCYYDDGSDPHNFNTDTLLRKMAPLPLDTFIHGIFPLKVHTLFII